MPERVDQQIGNYRLVRLLGSGEFADIYLGQHVHVQRLQSAVKVLHTNLSSAYHGGFLAEIWNCLRSKNSPMGGHAYG